MAVVEPGSERKGPRDSGAIWLARSLILAIPLVVMALFWVFAPFPTAPPMHGPSQLPRQAQAPGQAQTAPQGGDPARMSDAEMEQMAARLAARLEREPHDANGWSVLARTYYVMERFTQAVSAYEKLVALAAPDADLLADYADALAMAQGRRLEGKPMELVRKALEQNPSQWKALSMAATDAFQRGDFRAAGNYWERALAALPPESGMAESIRGSLAQARAASAAPRK